MPLYMNKRKAELKTVLIPFEDDTIKIVYKPSEWTTESTAELQEFEGAAQTRYSADLLSRLIVEWDLAEKEGAPSLPISKKTIMGLDQQIVNAIIDGVTEHMRPKARTGRR